MTESWIGVGNGRWDGDNYVLDYEIADPDNTTWKPNPFSPLSCLFHYFGHAEYVDAGGTPRVINGTSMSGPCGTYGTTGTITLPNPVPGSAIDIWLVRKNNQTDEKEALDHITIEVTGVYATTCGRLPVYEDTDRYIVDWWKCAFGFAEERGVWFQSLFW